MRPSVRYAASGDRVTFNDDGRDDRPLADPAHAMRKCGPERHRVLDETKYPLVRRGNIQAFSIVGATNQGRCLPGSGMWSRPSSREDGIGTEFTRTHAGARPELARGANIMEIRRRHGPIMRGELTDPKRRVGAIEKAYVRRPKAMSSATVPSPASPDPKRTPCGSWKRRERMRVQELQQPRTVRHEGNQTNQALSLNDFGNQHDTNVTSGGGAVGLIRCSPRAWHGSGLLPTDQVGHGAPRLAPNLASRNDEQGGNWKKYSLTPHGLSAIGPARRSGARTEWNPIASAHVHVPNQADRRLALALAHARARQAPRSSSLHTLPPPPFTRKGREIAVRGPGQDTFRLRDQPNKPSEQVLCGLRARRRK
ncbi:hypothetical protein H4582DRAFT_2055894 [Lactarius indigo]|nr:hypothetical protein H4582DRAFT_2055894 [Lactarius indigo]